MLIIFDLDDTLIDTSGSVTPVQLTRAIEMLVGQGVIFPDQQEAVDVLLRLNQTAPSARHALAEFFEISGIDDSLMPLAHDLVYYNIPDNIVVEAHHRAVEILQSLSEIHKLALVTVGREDLQLLKLKKAGIDSDIFSKIVVTPVKNKKTHYQSIVDEFDVDPSEVLVCGDRIAIDLSPAKELGCRTVQMLAGRGIHCRGDKSHVDYVISNLSEIIKILSEV